MSPRLICSKPCRRNQIRNVRDGPTVVESALLVQVGDLASNILERPVSLGDNGEIVISQHIT